MHLVASCAVPILVRATFDSRSCSPTFLLGAVLTRDGNPPPGPDLVGVAIPPPVIFKCRSDGKAPSLPPGQTGRGAILAAHFNCQFRQNQQTRVFKVNEIVSTTLDEEGNGLPPEDNVDGKGDVWLPPGPHGVPTVGPAGADAADESSAPWLIGLALAASGAAAGTVLIARRRFRHDS